MKRVLRSWLLVSALSVSACSDNAQHAEPDLSMVVDDGGVDAAMDLGVAADLAPDLIASDIATLPAVPDPPTNVVATAIAGGKVQLSWTAPDTADAGAPLTGYAIDSTPSTSSTTSATTSYTTPMLALGTQYVFHVRATSAAGPSQPADSNAVVAGDVPSAPMNVTATVPSGRAVVSWNLATANGSTITAYTVVASPGGKTITQGGVATSATFTGLTSGQQYTFTVTATNGFGDGPGATSNAAVFTCTNTSITLAAANNQTVSIDYGPPAVIAPSQSVTAKRDTRSSSNHDIYGWVQFTTAGSGLQSWGQITSMILNLNASALPITTGGIPQLIVWYSSNDAWDGTSASITAADIPRTLAVSSPALTVSGTTGWQAVPINVASRDWSGDVADGLFTLGIQNTVNPASAVSSIVYNGFDNVDPTVHPTLDLHVCQ